MGIGSFDGHGCLYKAVYIDPIDDDGNVIPPEGEILDAPDDITKVMPKRRLASCVDCSRRMVV